MNFVNKRLLIILTVVILSVLPNLWVFGQESVPQSLNYEAVARDSDGEPIVNKEIMVEVTISTGVGEDKNIVWQEVHKKVTNAFGLFSLQIGEGNSTFVGSANSFSEIDWSDEDYYIQTRVDFGSQEFGNGLIDLGNNKLQSVPYSLLADSALHAPIPEIKMSKLSNVKSGGASSDDILVYSGTTWMPRQGGFVKKDGSTDLTGDWTISSNDITLTDGKLSADSLDIGSTQQIIGISKDTVFSSVSNDSLATQQAIKTYVNNNSSSGHWELDGDYLYNTDQKIGIGTSSPTKKFQAAIEDDVFLVSGSYDPGVSRSINTGTRMGFLGNKAAFRAGSFGNDELNHDQIGSYSMAIGRNTKARGDFSISLGNNSKATAKHAFAVGEGNNATASYSIAMGNQNEAASNSSVAIGKDCEAGKTRVTPSYAFGNKAKANADSSFAMGIGTEVESKSEVAIGQFNVSYQSFASSVSTWHSNDLLFSIGNGRGDSYRSNALVILKNGNVGIGNFNKSNTPGHSLTVGTGPSDTATIVANDLYTRSDKRWKENLSPVNNAMSKVKKINGHYFYWKEGADNRQFGVMAQDVENVLPEIVNTGDDGYKSLDYSKLTPLLIEAVKEQNKTVDSLKEKTESQEKRIKELEQKYKNLNKRLEAVEDAVDK